MTYDVHLRTWLSYSGQRPCVKIWFRLVEPFKSYRVHKHPKKKKKKITDTTENNIRPFFGLILIIIIIMKIIILCNFDGN